MTIAQQRAAAEQRAHALLRGIVPEDEWRYDARRNGLGQIMMNREPTHLEFKGQRGKYTYQVWFHSTAENIQQLDSYGYSRTLCAGPYPWNDYITPNDYRQDRYLRMNDTVYARAREEAMLQGTQPLSLPPADIWLGQYLALKYDEKRFLEYANVL